MFQIFWGAGFRSTNGEVNLSNQPDDSNGNPDIQSSQFVKMV